MENPGKPAEDLAESQEEPNLKGKCSLTAHQGEHPPPPTSLKHNSKYKWEREINQLQSDRDHYEKVP